MSTEMSTKSDPPQKWAGEEEIPVRFCQFLTLADEGGDKL